MILGVTGITRCGSSLVMQMLSASGAPTVPGRESWPAFEDDRYLRNEPLFWRDCEGKAAKLIDLHLIGVPATHSLAWIIIHRNLREQVKSQAKFMRLLAGVHAKPCIKWQKSIGRDMARIDQLMGNAPILRLSFEHLVRPDACCAEQLSAFAEKTMGWDLDPCIMESQVRQRTAGCYQGLLEAEMIS